MREGGGLVRCILALDLGTSTGWAIRGHDGLITSGTVSLRPGRFDVANAKNAVSTNCIGCLECVQACPRGGTLEVQLAPTWLDPLKRPASLVQPAVEEVTQ